MQVSTTSPIYQGHEDRGIQVLVDARLWFRRHVIGINVWPPDVSRIVSGHGIVFCGAIDVWM